MKKKTIYDFVRTGQNIIYQDFSSIYKRIDYSKSKRLEMLDLLKKKGNCTIFAAKIKAWNSWVETAQPICALFFVCCENIFTLDDAFNHGCAVCSSFLNYDIVQWRMSPQVNMSSEPTVLNYMPLVVSSEFGKSAQFIILLFFFDLSG